MPKYIRAGSEESNLFSNRDMSASFESEWTDLELFSEARIQVTWTGASGVLNGKLFVETTTNTDFRSRFDESEATISSSTEEQTWEIEIRGKFYRIAYEANGITSGSMSATVTAKGE
jgi:hypothetical protein